MSNVLSFYPQQDTYIDSYYPNCNYDNCIVNRIGKKDRGSICRTLMRFDICPMPESAIVTKAILKLYVDAADNPKIIGKYTPYAVTAPWRAEAVTWNTCPAFDISLCGSTTDIGDKGWYEWDITKLMEAWIHKKIENFGMLIKSQECLPDDSKRVVAINNTKEKKLDLRPVLLIYYERSHPHKERVKLEGRKFIEKSIVVSTKDEFLPTEAFNTSQQSQVTLFVINMGAKPATVMLEVSPNNVNYALDAYEFEVSPIQTIAVVPRIYGKYTRLIYKSKNLSENTLLNIIFQSCV